MEYSNLREYLYDMYSGLDTEGANESEDFLDLHDELVSGKLTGERLWTFFQLYGSSNPDICINILSILLKNLSSPPDSEEAQEG